MNIFQPDGTTIKNPVTLLTLPSDEVEYQHGTAVETSSKSSLSSSSFVLLQLPLNFTVDDFIGSTNNTTNPNTYFVAAQNSNDANNHQQQQQPNAVCCVVESKACSFTVHRIETSNTLILVPPSSTPPSSIAECTHNTSTNDNQQQMITNDSDAIDDNSIENSNHASNDIHVPSQNKKMKGDTAIKLTRVLSAHLVQKPISTSGGGGGGTSTSGSYFLELRRKHLRLSDLRRALTVLDPYNMNHIDKNDDTATIGRTIFDLATSLQVSQLEIQQGLHHIGAYALPSKSSANQSYCLLAEYIMNDCYDAIVTGLYTMSDCTDDYGGTNGIINIDQLTFIKNIIHHIQEKDDVIVTNLESILLHCLQLLEKETILSHGKFILDVSKVAVCIVRRLFLKRTDPFNEKELFTMWQSELPGVGPTYQVSPTMLRGVAICIGDNNIDEEHNVDLGYHTSASSGRQWHYFPVESMSVDSQKCFDALFQIKHRYTMDELEPYLQHLIDTLPSHDTNNDHSSSNTSSSSVAVTELLLRYTKLITEVGLDGTTRTFYVKR